VTQAIGPIAAFPDSFTPLDLGDLALHRDPVMIVGRTVVRTAGVIDKLGAATVAITGIWRVMPTLTSSPPAAPANIVAVTPPLYASRPVGTSVNGCALMPDVANEKRLQRAAVAGATRVFLTDR